MTDSVHRELLTQFSKNSKLLNLLDSQGLTRLAAIGTLRSFAAAETVINEGDTGGTFYLITRGEMQVYTFDTGDKPVAHLGPGMFVGEMAVIAVQPRTATVVCKGPCSAIAFERGPVLEILQDYPKVREFLGGVGIARVEHNLSRMLQDENNDDEPNS